MTKPEPVEKKKTPRGMQAIDGIGAKLTRAVTSKSIGEALKETEKAPDTIETLSKALENLNEDMDDYLQKNA